MRTLITGAGGFLGSALVDEAARAGLEVRALGRTPVFGAGTGGIERVGADLRRDALEHVLRGVDTVVHSAFARGADPRSCRDSLAMTARLLSASARAGVRTLVLISSLAVLDYTRPATGATLHEGSALVSDPRRRDGYTRVKLRQERAARKWAAVTGGKVLVVRPGPLVGAGRVWTPRLGFRVGRAWVQVGGGAPVPLVHVRACAGAVIRALTCPAPPPVLHAINDRPPTQQEYIDLLVARGLLPPPRVSIGYRAARRIASAVWSGAGVVPSGRARLPGLCVPERLDARFRPMAYSCGLAQEFMGEWAGVSATAMLDLDSPRR
jgi:nucleoside-diphosphate-sugar epimerase